MNLYFCSDFNNLHSRTILTKDTPSDKPRITLGTLNTLLHNELSTDYTEIQCLDDFFKREDYLELVKTLSCTNHKSITVHTSSMDLSDKINELETLATHNCRLVLDWEPEISQHKTILNTLKSLCTSRVSYIISLPLRKDKSILEMMELCNPGIAQTYYIGPDFLDWNDFTILDDNFSPSYAELADIIPDFVTKCANLNPEARVFIHGIPYCILKNETLMTKPQNVYLGTNYNAGKSSVLLTPNGWEIINRNWKGNSCFTSVCQDCLYTNTCSGLYTWMLSDIDISRMFKTKII